jgi:hypothetical protein
MSPYTRHVIRHIAIILVVFLLVNFLAAALIGFLEDLDYTDSFYLSMSASTLSGYGNVAASTPGGKWFISFFQLFGFAVFFYALSVIVVVDIGMRGLEGNGANTVNRQHTVNRKQAANLRKDAAEALLI